MSDKKAFVFDTNFIVQNKKLTDVIDKLKDSYNLYVTQLSIDERIAQQVRERNVVYDEAEKLSRVTTLFQTVGDNMTQETASQALVSTLKGFQMDADQAIDIVDKFNEVECCLAA